MREDLLDGLPQQLRLLAGEFAPTMYTSSLPRLLAALT